MKVAISYSTITEESAKEGDYAEVGWEDEDGTEFDTVDEVVDFLKSVGVIEPSSTCAHPGIWYTDEGDVDMYTGETKMRNFHLKNMTAGEQIDVFIKMFPEYHKRCKRIQMFERSG